MKKLLQNVYEELNADTLFLINGGYSTTSGSPRRTHYGNFSSYANLTGGRSVELDFTDDPNSYELPTSDEIKDAIDTLTGDSNGGTEGGTNNTPDKPKEPITASNPDGYHCDILAYNKALEEGIQNPGEWGEEANEKTVDQIYNENYNGEGTDSPEDGTRGYGFRDTNGDGVYDHVFYYDNRDGGENYSAWDSNGKEPLIFYDNKWSKEGRTAQETTFVALE